MRTKLIAAAAIAIGATAVVIAPVHAATAGECQVLIADLSDDTAAAGSLTARSSTGLVAKADAAGAKLEAEKVADALQKLTDYESTLEALHGAAKPKISEGDYLVLSSGVDDAIACVASIGTS